MALFARALFLNCIDRSRYRFRVRAMDRTRVSLPIGGRGFSGVAQRRTELAESAALKKSAARLRSERDLPKKGAAIFAREATCVLRRRRKALPHLVCQLALRGSGGGALGFPSVALLTRQRPAILDAKLVTGSYKSFKAGDPTHSVRRAGPEASGATRRWSTSFHRRSPNAPPARLRIRDKAFEYGERHYNPRRRYSKSGCLGPMEFEAGVMPT